MTKLEYKCRDCNWQGPEHDMVETCFGADEIEMCPKCGSYNLVMKKE